MFKQRPGIIGAFTGAAVPSILFTFFPDSIGGMIEDLADYVPVESLALRWLDALTENRRIGFVVTAGFIAALLFSFSDVARSGSAIPDRPVSFLLVVVLFLPYALRSMVELVWS